LELLLELMDYKLLSEILYILRPMKLIPIPPSYSPSVKTAA